MRSGADVAAALDFTDRVLAMIDDPDLHSDRLLLGLALLAELEQRRRAGRKPEARMDGKRNAWVAARDHATDERHRPNFLHHALSDDVPRYEVAGSPWGSIPCCGHMLRPAGAPCTKRGRSRSSSIPDANTGERTWLGSCSNPRHIAEFERIHRDAWQAWRDAGEPKPAHNTGGILARYFDTEWETIYDWARPYRDHGDPAGKSPTPPRPRLTLVPRQPDTGR